MSATSQAAVRRGGEWLITDTPVGRVFTPERLSDEHRLVGRTAAEFVAQEVVPAQDALEAKDWTRVRALLQQCGDLGLLGVDTPEAYGGVGMDKAAAVVVGEAVGGVASFATSFGAQTGLAIVPILCFGTPDQQQRYLPRILSGECLGAYCLSESTSGSDALGARARATRDADGGWTLTGEKLWITSGGFADVFIVFAKVDGEHFSAFIVERGFPGVSNGKEEHKMGLHGSSTTPLILAEARVPAANLLGEVGKGHKIAFNVLNYGRFKLGAMCTGGAKAAFAEAVAYAAARRQFGQPIATFGAIQHKIGEMTARLYAVESMLFRTAGLIDDAVGATGHDDVGAVATALEEFAIESSLLKVASSEMVDYVVDEEVQIHGGNGFVRDYPAERRYRDARVNRIFEGTNEINRMLVPGTMIKRALKGGPAVLREAAALRDAILGGDLPAVEVPDDRLAPAFRAAASLKRAAILTLGMAAETYGETLASQQEVLMLVSDLLIDAFAGESAALRAAQARADDATRAEAHADAALVFTHDAALRGDAAARTACAAMRDGDELRAALVAMRRLFKVEPVNTVAARRRLAALALERRGYGLGY